MQLTSSILLATAMCFALTEAQNFGRPQNSQNFGQPQNFDQQNSQDFGQPQDSQNFGRPQNSQNFGQPQNFGEPQNSRDFGQSESSGQGQGGRVPFNNPQNYRVQCDNVAPGRASNVCSRVGGKRIGGSKCCIRDGDILIYERTCEGYQGKITFIGSCS